MAFKINENVSEFIGAIVGDGCLSRYWSNYDKRWKCVISFTGQWDHDRDYYKNIIQKISEEELGYKGYLYHRKDDNSIRFFIGSKNLFFFLRSLGLPSGLKERIILPKEISDNLNFAKACVRGIFNTDGSVYQRYNRAYYGHPKHYKNYAVIQIRMKNKNIIEFVKDTLDKLGFRTNRVTPDGCGYWVCRITTQKDVKRFFEEISNKHQYHINRYNKISQIQGPMGP